MNINEASKQFNLSESTIYEYLKLGLFEHAKKNKQGHWVISKNALKPYRLPVNQERSVEVLIVHVLKALNNNQSISTHHFGLSKSKIKALFSVLEKEDFILQIERDQDDIFKMYTISFKGIQFLNQSKQTSFLVNLLKKINFNINLNI